MNLNQNKLSKASVMLMMRALSQKGPHSPFASLWVKDQKTSPTKEGEVSTLYEMTEDELRDIIRYGEKLKVNIESDKAIFPQNVQVDPVHGFLLSSYDGSRKDWQTFMQHQIQRDELPHHPRPSIYL